jgi:hypothetical protein
VTGLSITLHLLAVCCGGLPARAYPQPLSLGKDQLRYSTIDHRVWLRPACVAQVQDGLAGVTVIDEHGLLSILVLKIAQVLIGTDVIDVGWYAALSRVVIADLKERASLLFVWLMIGSNHERVV